MGEMLQVNSIAVFCRTWRGFLRFSMSIANPAILARCIVAWESVEKRYLGNCNGLRYIKSMRTASSALVVSDRLKGLDLERPVP
jgi:hypothetical protein